MEGPFFNDFPCFLNGFPMLFNAFRWDFIPWDLCNRTCGPVGASMETLEGHMAFLIAFSRKTLARMGPSVKLLEAFQKDFQKAF